MVNAHSGASAAARSAIRSAGAASRKSSPSPATSSGSAAEREQGAHRHDEQRCQPSDPEQRCLRARRVVRERARRARQDDERRLHDGVVIASAAPAAIAACPVAAAPTPSSAHAGAAPRCTTCVSAPPAACSRAKRSTPAGSVAAAAPRSDQPTARGRAPARPRCPARSPRSRRRARRRVQRERPDDDDAVLERIAQAPRRHALEPEGDLRQQRGRRAEDDRREHERDLRRAHRAGRERDAERRAQRQHHDDAHRAPRRAAERAPARPRPLRAGERPEHAREQRRPADARRGGDPGRDGQRDREAAVVGGTKRARDEQHEARRASPLRAPSRPRCPRARAAAGPTGDPSTFSRPSGDMRASIRDASAPAAADSRAAPATDEFSGCRQVFSTEQHPAPRRASS